MYNIQSYDIEYEYSYAYLYMFVHVSQTVDYITMHALCRKLPRMIFNTTRLETTA